MTIAIPKRRTRLMVPNSLLWTSALCVALAGPALEASEGAEKGDLWETTSQMSMEGAPMTMPAQTARICAPKEWKEPPAGGDERQKCQASEFKVTGAKATWKVKCAGPPEMSGEGEITRDGTEAWAGRIHFESAEMKMTIKLTGRRVGECDLPKK